MYHIGITCHLLREKQRDVDPELIPLSYFYSWTVFCALNYMTDWKSVFILTTGTDVPHCNNDSILFIAQT